MTTIVTTDRTEGLTADGFTPIPFDFQAISDHEVGVLRNGVEQLGGFTVTVNGDGTGVVTPGSDWGVDAIVIFSKPDYTQPANYPRWVPLFPDQVMSSLDRLARTIISVKEQFNRAVFGDISVTLPPQTVKLSGAVEGTGLNGDAGVVTTFGKTAPATVIANPSIAEAAPVPVALTAGKLFGARGDGTVGPVTLGANLALADDVLNASGGGAGTADWGGIGGTLAEQTDLKAALDAKASIGSKVYTPFDFGAVNDPAVDNYAKLLDALESGETIDGLGRTYSLSEELMPSVLTKFTNANLQWISDSEAQQQGRSLLHIYGLSNFIVDGVNVDMGNVLNTGSENDSGRRGILIDAPAGVRCARFWLMNCNGRGKGNGTTFDIRNTQTAKILNNISHDRQMIMGDAGTADNDAMDGFVLQDGNDIIFMGNQCYDNSVSTDGGTTYTRDYNRGVAITGQQNGIIANNHMRLVGQGFDFSGNLSVNGGNRGLNIYGNSGAYCFSWAFKFVHGIKDCAISNCLARYTGRNGFVFNSDDYADPTDHTQRLHFTNCHAIQGWAPPYSAQNYASAPTGGWSKTWRGFRIQANDPTNGPRNMRFQGCSAFDDQAYMDYGFFSDLTVDKTSNIFRNCEAFVQGSGANFKGDYNSNIAASAFRKL